MLIRFFERSLNDYLVSNLGSRVIVKTIGLHLLSRGPSLIFTKILFLTALASEIVKIENKKEFMHFRRIFRKVSCSDLILLGGRHIRRLASR